MMDQAVGDAVEPLAAILRIQVRAEQPHFGHLRHQLPWKGTGFIMRNDDRKDPLLHPPADLLADHPLLGPELVVQIQKIDPLKCHRALPAAYLIGSKRGTRPARRSATRK